jgi:hypothetical protein
MEKKKSHLAAFSSRRPPNQPVQRPVQRSGRNLYAVLQIGRTSGRLQQNLEQVAITVATE